MTKNRKSSNTGATKAPGTLESRTVSDSSLFFFFQAEDGIRDYKVTGVQTCALPILAQHGGLRLAHHDDQRAGRAGMGRRRHRSGGRHAGPAGVDADSARRRVPSDRQDRKSVV